MAFEKAPICWPLKLICPECGRTLGRGPYVIRRTAALTESRFRNAGSRSGVEITGRLVQYQSAVVKVITQPRIGTAKTCFPAGQPVEPVNDWRLPAALACSSKSICGMLWACIPA